VSDRALRVALIGRGKMGQAIAALAPARRAEVVATLGRDAEVTTRSLEGADVAIEFTEPAAAAGNARACLAAGVPVVVGTTGWLDALPGLTRDAERQGREAMLRSTELLIRPAVGRPGAEAAAEQVKEDFTHIQVLRNNIARHMARGGPLDLKLIAREAKEVNKRANRLREHLMPQAPKDWAAEPPNTPALDPDGMAEALVALCQRIDSFTENPVFKVIGVVNVEESARAGGDLQNIIRLSGRVREGAARLHRAARK